MSGRESRLYPSRVLNSEKTRCFRFRIASECSASYFDPGNPGRNVSYSTLNRTDRTWCVRSAFGSPIRAKTGLVLGVVVSTPTSTSGAVPVLLRSPTLANVIPSPCRPLPRSYKKESNPDYCGRRSSDGILPPYSTFDFDLDSLLKKRLHSVILTNLTQSPILERYSCRQLLSLLLCVSVHWRVCIRCHPDSSIRALQMLTEQD